MSRFDAVMNPQPPEDPFKNLVKISGSFQCQTCGECVNNALYNPEKSELGWKCENGHISAIGGFDI